MYTINCIVSFINKNQLIVKFSVEKAINIMYKYSVYCYQTCILLNSNNINHQCLISVMLLLSNIEIE